MNRLALVISSVLCVILAVPFASASFTWLPYYNAYNATVSNWTYINAQGFTSHVGYALVQIPNSIDTELISTRAYDSAGNNRGNVPFWVIEQNSISNGTAVLLLANRTNESFAWTNVTIFYNPVSPFVNITGAQASGYQQSFNSSQLGNSRVTYFTPLSSTGYYNFTPYYSNSSNTIVEFNLNLNDAHSFVVVSNHSLTANAFNVTWIPTDLIGFNSLSTGTAYKLCSTNGGCVTNPATFSRASNEIFANNGIGYEGWFGVTSNQIFSDGMSKVGSSQVCNSLGTCASTGFYPQLMGGDFYLNVGAYSHSQIDILPAFTTNINMHAPTLNPNPQTNVSTGCSYATFYCYDFKLPITNITWTYHFNSTASNPSNALSLNFSHLGYAILKFPQNLAMGAYCGDINVRAFENYSGFADYGSVPFYVLNCSGLTSTVPHPYAEILIPNVSSLGYTFNDVDVYYGSLLFSSGTPSNSTVFHNWQFAFGNYITYNAVALPIRPFNVTLQHPLNANSSIYTAYVSGMTTPETYYGNSGSNYYVTSIGYTYNSLFPYTSMLVSPEIYGVTGCTTLATQFLSSSIGTTGCPSSGSIRIRNYTLNTTFGFSGYFLGLYFNLFQNNATLTYLSTMKYTLAPTLQNPNTGNFVNNFTIPYPNVTTTIPIGYNGVDYGNTTTINFQASNAVTRIGDTGVGIQTIALIAFDVFALLVGIGLFKDDDKLGHFPMFLIMFALWFSGAFTTGNAQDGFIAVASFVTLVFVLRHFIHRKRVENGDDR